MNIPIIEGASYRNVGLGQDTSREWRVELSVVGGDGAVVLCIEYTHPVTGQRMQGAYLRVDKAKLREAVESCQ